MQTINMLVNYAHWFTKVCALKDWDFFLTTMIEKVSLCSSNSPLGLIINELHRMTLRGTVKQYVYDITNHMSLESCRKLRGLTHLLSEQNLQVSMSKFFLCGLIYEIVWSLLVIFFKFLGRNHQLSVEESFCWIW